MSHFELSWNGCIPVSIDADSADDAKEQFAMDARERGHAVQPEDVEVVN
jgi:hypothetical protein